MDQNNFKHLSPLKWPKSLSKWKNGFDVETGQWSRQVAENIQNDTSGQTNRRARRQL